MPDTTVKYFDSTMSGAPSLGNTAGALIGVLDACLVNGFGSVTLDSLVVASDVATGSISTGHNLAMVGDTGPVIKIEGATPAGLNGEWRLASVPTANTFTFATSGISDQTATGTITAKRAPAGFSKSFSGVNKAAYRSDDITGTRLYLQADDTATTSARVIGYETMSDVDTGTGPFPTEAQISGGGYVYKANGANRAWKLFSDGQMVYFFNDPSGNASWSGGFVFGDIDSYVASDAYGCTLLYATTSTSAPSIANLSNATGGVLARAYTQIGGSITSARYSHGKNSALGQDGEAYPAVADNSMHLSAVEVWEATTRSRGMMPGLWNPVHASGLSHGLVVENIPQLPDRTLLTQKLNASSAALDLTGPWR